jgi:hypothetical protein
LVLLINQLREHRAASLQMINHFQNTLMGMEGWLMELEAWRATNQDRFIQALVWAV